MRGGSPLFLLSIVVFLIIVDTYTFRGIRMITNALAPVVRYAIYSMYWLVPLVVLLLLAWISQHMQTVFTTEKFRVWYFLMGFFILFYVPKLVFIVFQVSNDIVRIIGFVLAKLGPEHVATGRVAQTMTRGEFLIKAGLVISAIPFLSVLQGIVIGRFNYKVKNVKLVFPNLPKSFNGIRIVQISDWHIGSFWGQTNKVQKAVELINAQQPDIILFTGDMVNNTAAELEPFVPVLKQLNARMGKYAILGNHDYGEYVHWDSELMREENMQHLYRLEEACGFQLLRNESVIVEKDNESIGIAGVENWGLPPFPQYGNIEKALEGLSEVPFKILLSHDPSHWDVEVLKHSHIDLTLSGHTHGMQFGINIPGIKWSPVKWKYPRWSGIYQEGMQYLYVNVGIGYIGFPGRVGFYPEITVFVLHS